MFTCVLSRVLIKACNGRMTGNNSPLSLMRFIQIFVHCKFVVYIFNSQWIKHSHSNDRWTKLNLSSLSTNLWYHCQWESRPAGAGIMMTSVCQEFQINIRSNADKTPPYQQWMRSKLLKIQQCWDKKCNCTGPQPVPETFTVQYCAHCRWIGVVIKVIALYSVICFHSSQWQPRVVKVQMQ